MALLSPMLALVAAIGADIKSLRLNSSVLAINGATRLIQTQRITAAMVLREQIK